jgi:MFS family permease
VSDPSPMEAGVAVEAAAAAPSIAAPPPPATGLAGRWPALGVLGIRDFRYYWLATLAYFIVFGSQRFTFVWLVLDLSGRAGLAGTSGFALGIPAFFITLPAGVWADRWNRGRMVVGANVAGALVTLLVAGLLSLDLMNVPLALIAALALGAVAALMQPPLMAVVPSIVPRERLMNAIVLRTMGQNVAQILGASVGGGAIALWGFAGSFAVQAVAYTVAAVSMALVVVPSSPPGAGPRPSMLPQIREGLTFVFSNPALRALVLIMVSSGLFMLGPVFVLVPEIARSKLDQEAFAASVLFAVTGSGMLLMSVVLASMQGLRRKGRVFVLNMFVGAPILAGMGLAPWYPALAFFMFAWGLGGGIFINLNQTLLQEHTPDRVMGRVMSIAGLSIAGIIPLGSLLAGAAAEVVGADTYMVICGAAILATAALVALTQPELWRME